MAVTSAAKVAGNAHARRFVKFCIVGASSMTIQFIVMNILAALIHGAGHQGHWVVPTATAVAAIPAIVNGFYWNRRWTFEQGHTENAGQQFWLFVAVNLVGIALNYGFMYLFNEKLALFHGFPHSRALNFLLTVVCVTSWNFLANSKWTFKTL